MIQTRFNNAALTDVMLMLAFGFFLLGIAELKELVDGINTDVVDEENFSSGM